MNRPSVLSSVGLLLASAALLAACTSTVVRTERGTAKPPVTQTPPPPPRPATPPATTPPATAPGGTQAVTPATRVSQPKYGATHVVQRGETVYRIATSNGITPLDLALWNAIPPPYTIRPGQRLRLYPADAARPPVATRPPASGGTRPAPPPGNTAAPASQLAWRWPTDGGNILSTYLANDATRQGIDIAGNGGEPVRAAADGTVVYSGAGLVGYGELIIIKHNDQWLSAYGHNRRRLVNEGSEVRAGQQIAELGSTGTSRNMLHFEIRHNGKPVDPQQYLPRR